MEKYKATNMLCEEIVGVTLLLDKPGDKEQTGFFVVKIRIQDGRDDSNYILIRCNDLLASPHYARVSIDVQN